MVGISLNQIDRLELFVMVIGTSHFFVFKAAMQVDITMFAPHPSDSGKTIVCTVQMHDMSRWIQMTDKAVAYDMNASHPCSIQSLRPQNDSAVRVLQ